MRTAKTTATVVCALAVAAGLGLAGCHPSSAYCGRLQECNDRLESDSGAVCVQSVLKEDRMLRANDEDACHRLADAWLAFYACVASLECRDILDGDYDACEGEQDALADANQDADGECLSLN